MTPFARPRYSRKGAERGGGVAIPQEAREALEAAFHDGSLVEPEPAVLEAEAPAPEDPLPSRGAPDLERLTRAVEGLVERYRELRAENERMRGELADREQQLAELSQQRGDARKRIDALIAQIEAIDARLESGS